MLNNDLTQQIKRNFSFQPTKEQQFAIESFSRFVLEGNSLSIFLLKGYAGTGKTSVVSAMVEALLQRGMKCVLLAPTGRAAKVLSRYSGQPAFTIHKRIYRQKVFSNEMDNFSLNKNFLKDTLYIIDEASMISNDGFSGSMFGSGRLFDDLMEYIYGTGDGCRLMLIGDTAQLPPVGESESPALNADFLAGYGLDVTEARLTEVVRQEMTSGILYNATKIRGAVFDEALAMQLKVSLSYPDISIVNGEQLIDALTASYDKIGMDETIVICRSNKRANIFNQGIRNTILFREDELNSGDMLMIAKNNYYWGEKVEGMEFIANGDVAVVRRMRRTQEMYGFRFADVVLAFPDYNDTEIEVKVLLNTLHSEAPALSKAENDALFAAVMEDYMDISTQRERMKKLKTDVFYNALQVKYAYAVTCHKAQGGQWSHVYLDKGYVPDEMKTTDYYRWLYTAFTRATEHLYLINWAEEDTEP